MIYMDSDEARKWPEIAQGLWDIVEVRDLEAGDYRIPGVDGLVVVERKTSVDLVNSVKTSRLNDQIRSILDLNALPVLLIEGRIDTRDGRLATEHRSYPFPYTWLSNYLVTLQLSGVLCVWSPSVRATVEILRGLHSYFQRSEHSSTRSSFLRFSPQDPFPVRILSVLPGYSSDLARRALSHFKTLRAFFSASPRDRMQVPGIGEKKARIVDWVLDMEVTP